MMYHHHKKCTFVLSIFFFLRFLILNTTTTTVAAADDSSISSSNHNNVVYESSQTNDEQILVTQTEQQQQQKTTSFGIDNTEQHTTTTIGDKQQQLNNKDDTTVAVDHTDNASSTVLPPVTTTNDNNNNNNNHLGEMKEPSDIGKRIWGTSDQETTESSIATTTPTPTKENNNNNNMFGVMTTDDNNDKDESSNKNTINLTLLDTVDNSQISERMQQILNELKDSDEKQQQENIDSVDADVLTNLPDGNHETVEKMKIKSSSSTTTTTITNKGSFLESESSEQVIHNEDHTKRLWGSAAQGGGGGSVDSSHVVEPLSTKNVEENHSKHDTILTNETHNRSTLQHQSHIPFVPSKHNLHQLQHHNPPEGFTFKARVYIDPKDALAHFDYEEDSMPQQIKELTLPYWDCGVTGSTTAPLRLRDAYFRNAMGSITSWNGASGDGLHPVLVVSLTSSLLELNSGESIELKSGDVLLLEDMIRPGHRFQPLNSKEADIKLLFLTLPQYHYHTGKDRLSLKEAMETIATLDPCPVQMDEQQQTFDDLDTLIDKKKRMHGLNGGSSTSSSSSRSRNTRKGSKKISRTTTDQPPFWDAHKVRYLVLGTIGMSLSTIVADFIGKTAPLWLAVGIGGTFFVGFGTYGFIIATDQLVSNIELWRERRRLVLGPKL